MMLLLKGFLTMKRLRSAISFLGPEVKASGTTTAAWATSYAARPCTCLSRRQRRRWPVPHQGAPKRLFEGSRAAMKGPTCRRAVAYRFAQELTPSRPRVPPKAFETSFIEAERSSRDALSCQAAERVVRHKEPSSRRWPWLPMAYLRAQSHPKPPCEVDS